MPRGTQREKIRDVYLVPHHSDQVRVYPPVISAIEDAELILLGPGDLFTSILPNLIVPGVKEALRAAGAPIYYIINIMTKYGETHRFKAQDFVTELEDVLQRKLDGIIANATRPETALLDAYSAQKAEFVEVDPSDGWWGERRIVVTDLLDDSGGVLRHDSRKLAALIERIAQDLTPGARPEDL